MMVNLQCDQMKGEETIIMSSIFTPQTMTLVSTFLSNEQGNTVTKGFHATTEETTK